MNSKEENNKGLIDHIIKRASNGGRLDNRDTQILYNIAKDYRALLEKLENPTEEMIAAGIKYVDQAGGIWHVKGLLKAMAKALEER